MTTAPGNATHLDLASMMVCAAPLSFRAIQWYTVNIVDVVEVDVVESLSTTVVTCQQSHASGIHAQVRGTLGMLCRRSEMSCAVQDALVEGKRQSSKGVRLE